MSSRIFSNQLEYPKFINRTNVDAERKKQVKDKFVVPTFEESWNKVQIIVYYVFSSKKCLTFHLIGFLSSEIYEYFELVKNSGY